MPELVLLVGLPASGKSTFYRERFAATHVLVSKDAMSKSANKARRQRQEIETALARGFSVVVDNTNVGTEERAAAIAAAQPFGGRIVVYRFVESVAACRERNAGRENLARVPLVALYAAAKRYQAPTLAEGIDAIHTVRLGAEGFILEE